MGFAAIWAWPANFSFSSLSIIGYGGWPFINSPAQFATLVVRRLGLVLSIKFTFFNKHRHRVGHSNKYPNCGKPWTLYARQRIDFCHPFDPHCGSFLFLKLFVWQMFRRLWCTGKISSSNFVLLWVAGGKYFNCGYILHSSYRAVCVCKPCHFRSCCGLTSPLLFSFLQAAGYRHYF